MRQYRQNNFISTFSPWSCTCGYDNYSPMRAREQLNNPLLPMKTS